MVKCKHKRRSHPNLKGSEKNNKEILKLLQLSNNKENKEKLLTKPENKKLPKRPNNMKLNIKLLNKPNLLPEETLNYLDKFLFQLNQNSHSLSESEVSSNSTQELPEFLEF